METQLTFLESVILTARSDEDEYTAVTAVAECEVRASWSAESDPAFLQSIALVKRAFREPIGSEIRARLVLESFEVMQPKETSHAG